MAGVSTNGDLGVIINNDLYMHLPYPLILASNSPRRKELLANAGFRFKIVVKPVDETIPEGFTPVNAAVAIADRKINLYADLAKDNIVICADTIVAFNYTILGKAKNADDALRMLQLINGETHEVITAVAIAYPKGKFSFSVTTEVTLYKLETNELKAYIRAYKPFDKAGAYGIQEWFGHAGVRKINGSYTNVVGLPISQLYHKLKSLSA